MISVLELLVIQARCTGMSGIEAIQVDISNTVQSSLVGAMMLWVFGLLVFLFSLLSRFLGERTIMAINKCGLFAMPLLGVVLLSIYDLCKVLFAADL